MAKRKTRKRVKRVEETFEQDEYFYFIAGYTEGGAPYGITWEEASNEGLIEKEKERISADDKQLPF